MRFTITDTSPCALLRLAIKDVCSGYEPAANPEESDTMITLEELRTNILAQLDGVLDDKEKEFVTPGFLRGELKNNNLVETVFTTDEGMQEIWFLKKITNKNKV